MAEIKLSIEEQRVLNDVFKRLTENMGYTENALVTALGDLLGGVRSPALISNVQISIKTCSFLDARLIGDGMYDARWNASSNNGFVFGSAGNGGLTLVYDNTLPNSTPWWAEITPGDPLLFTPPMLTFHFKNVFQAPSVGEVNNTIQALAQGDYLQQTHLANGANGQVAAYARWDGDPAWRARTIGAAGNVLTLFLAADGLGPLPNVTFVGTDFVVHYVVNVSSYKDVKDAMNAVAFPNNLIVTFVEPGDDTFILDGSLDGYGGGFSGGQDATAGTKATLKLFDLGNHHIDTEIEAFVANLAGNNITIQTGRNDALTGVVIQRSGTHLTVFFQNNVSTVGDFEAAIAALTGADQIIDVKTPSANPSRVLTYDNKLFFQLDGDHPGSVNTQALTSSTVGTGYLSFGTDGPTNQVYREQYLQFTIAADDVGDGGLANLFFGDGQFEGQGFPPPPAPLTAIHKYAQAAGITVMVGMQDLRSPNGIQAVGLFPLLVNDWFSLPGTKAPTLFYTATFDGLNGGGFISTSGSLRVQGSTNDPFYQVTQPQGGDRIMFLAEVGAGSGFVTLGHGINGQGNIALTGPNVVSQGGKAPQGGDVIDFVTKFDPVTGAWTNAYHLGTDFATVIQFSGPSLFQNNAGLDTSGVSISVMYHGHGISPVLFDGNSLNQSGDFSSTLDPSGRVFQRNQNDLSGRSYIALCMRPGR